MDGNFVSEFRVICFRLCSNVEPQAAILLTIVPIDNRQGAKTNSQLRVPMSPLSQPTHATLQRLSADFGS